MLIPFWAEQNLLNLLGRQGAPVAGKGESAIAPVVVFREVVWEQIFGHQVTIFVKIDKGMSEKCLDALKHLASYVSLQK